MTVTVRSAMARCRSELARIYPALTCFGLTVSSGAPGAGHCSPPRLGLGRDLRTAGALFRIRYLHLDSKEQPRAPECRDREDSSEESRELIACLTSG